MTIPLATPGINEQLCQACGLCCDGSLFGRARLASDEVASARKHGLRVVGNGGSFEQPCSALVNRSCTIYDARPCACRAFTCRLYERDGPLAAKLAIVGRTQQLLADLEARGAPSDGVDDDPRIVEVAKLLEEHFQRAVPAVSEK